jgi:hypothetical protein
MHSSHAAGTRLQSIAASSRGIPASKQGAKMLQEVQISGIPSQSTAAVFPEDSLPFGVSSKRLPIGTEGGGDGGSGGAFGWFRQELQKAEHVGAGIGHPSVTTVPGGAEGGAPGGSAGGSAGGGPPPTVRRRRQRPTCSNAHVPWQTSEIVARREPRGGVHVLPAPNSVAFTSCNSQRHTPCWLSPTSSDVEFPWSLSVRAPLPFTSPLVA